MTIQYVRQQPPDPRRQGRCPTCQAMQGERCFDRPRNGVHPARLKANGIDPKTLPPLRGVGGKRRRRKGTLPAAQPAQRRVSRRTDATSGLPVVRAPRKPKPTDG